LNEPELRMVAEVVAEMARFRGRSFGKSAKGYAFARAALIDSAFKARLAEVHRQLVARRSTDMPRKLLAPIAPLLPGASGSSACPAMRSRNVWNRSQFRPAGQ
jgi:hypothetical protein